MAAIPTLPAMAGLACGLSLYPILLSLTTILKRRSALREEEARLKDTTFILSGDIPADNMRRDIKNLMDGNRQGVLHFYTGRRKGYILFRDGAVIDIFYRNKSGLEALELLLNLTDGEYYFESRAVYQPSLFDGDITEMLVEQETEE